MRLSSAHALLTAHFTFETEKFSKIFWRSTSGVQGSRLFVSFHSDKIFWFLASSTSLALSVLLYLTTNIQNLDFAMHVVIDCARLPWDPLQTVLLQHLGTADLAATRM